MDNPDAAVMFDVVYLIGYSERAPRKDERRLIHAWTVTAPGVAVCGRSVVAADAGAPFDIGNDRSCRRCCYAIKKRTKAFLHTHGLKVCSTCGQTKALDDFPRRTLSNDGRTSECRVCWNKRQARLRESLPKEEMKRRRSRYSRTYIQRHPQRVRNKRFMERYGISVEDYAAMLEAQESRCAICRDQPPKPLFVDHDHQTLKIRGLLCEHCNIGLGRFRDTPALLRAAARYLEGSK